jgi:trimeric autotransporter adhesin
MPSGRHHLGRLRWPLLGATAAGLILATTTAIAGSGVGAPFNLGQANTVNATSSLSGQTNAPQLKVLNSGTSGAIAVYGVHSDPGSAAPAIRGDSSSTATGAFSLYGLISSATPGTNSAAVRGQNNGTGASGIGVFGSQAGSGYGVYGTAVTGIGVYGRHTGATGTLPGTQGESASAAAPGLLGRNTAGGPALSLLVNGGVAPFTVNSATKVTNLNADQLDGLDSAAFQLRVSDTCAVGSAIRVVNGNGTVACQATGEGSDWALAGNTGTNPSTQFLGTTDNTPLNVRVNNQRVFRFEPDASGPNIVGGSSANSVSGAHGGTIAGGGVSGFPNQVGANFGTVGGGSNNSANGIISTIGGGTGNTTSAYAATIPGGLSNAAAGEYSFAGGRRAKANHNGAFVWADSQDADFASTGANEFSVRAGGGVRFAVGGNTCSLDTGTGQWSGSCTPPGNFWMLGGNSGTTAGTDFLGTTDEEPLELKVNGQRALRLEPAPSQDAPNVIAGAAANTVTSGVKAAALSGGSGPSPNEVTDEFGTVSGGRLNRAGDDAGTTSDATSATVGGGSGNVAGNSYATVSGGRENTADGTNAAVGGGWFNQASGDFSGIPGGGFNTVTGEASTIGGGTENSASGTSATIGGGHKNTAAGDYTTIGGGGSGTNGFSNEATDDYGTVAGGQDNVAGDGGATTDRVGATVGGGVGNTASGQGSFIGGGSANVAEGDRAAIGGGSGNTASVARATVGGGFDNSATGLYATVPGGDTNVASGQRSFAAGRNAKANHDGTFVWGDSQQDDIASSAADQFIARAQGHFFLQSDSTLDDQGGFINTSTTAFLSTGGTWTNASSRALKTGFKPVRTGRVLDWLSALPITTWEYKSEPGVTHIGPVAEDFRRTFRVGADGKHISTVDEGGVALAAIQGLYRQNQALKRQNRQLGERLTKLERVVSRLSR